MLGYGFLCQDWQYQQVECEVSLPDLISRIKNIRAKNQGVGDPEFNSW